MEPDLQAELTKIAVENLLLDDAGTLETRHMDSLDFHTNSVCCIKNALEQAYELGRKEAATK